MIPDARARTIAADWHDSRDASYQFSSSGAITEPIRRIFRQLAAETGEPDLIALTDYLDAHADRGPVPGWSRLWQE